MGTVYTYQIKASKYDNPFYHNYVFKDFDINRVKISKWEYPILFFLTTYVQLTDNYIIKYKVWKNRYYFVGYEDWPPEQTET